MTIRRVTISLPNEPDLDDGELERLWRAFYREVNPRGAAVRRADAMFRRLKKAAAGQSLHGKRNHRRIGAHARDA